MFKNPWAVWMYLVLAALLYMPLLGHLNDLPIRLWDESRQAISAYEMLHSGNWIVTTFDKKPDLWNTKPPLLIWCQVLMMKLIGVNELSVRLPSAFAALLTCALLLWFSARWLGSFWFGFISILVLITSQGYVCEHGTRTGDYDAMLTLFTTLYGLLFFLYCENKDNRFLYLFFLSAVLGVLTKSVSAMLFMPAIAIYGIYRGQTITLLTNKHFYFSLLMFIGIVAGYYTLREHYNPGYIQAVIDNELGGRYLHTIEGHEWPYWFYLDQIIEHHFTAWYLFVPCGFVTGLFINNKKIRRLTVFTSVMIVTYFLIISGAETKIFWYDLPLYPFLSILVAVFIHFVFTAMEEATWIEKPTMKMLAPMLLLLILGFTPYSNMIARTYLPKEYSYDEGTYELSHLLKVVNEDKSSIYKGYLVQSGYNAHVQFYTNLLNDKGVSLPSKHWTTLQPNDTAIVWQDELKQVIIATYNHKILSERKNITFYLIYDKRN